MKIMIMIKYDQELYFNNIEPIIYEYHIGGYQVLSKWMKDRKGKKLSDSNIRHYCKIVTAIDKTIKLQVDIDKLVEERILRNHL